MPGGHNTKIWARTVVMLGAALLAAMVCRAPTGLSLAAQKGGISFELKAAFVRIAFDIGQKCSITDKCGMFSA
ncbi:MAG: hypothetical protein V4574_18700 [Pseudomonadota bacterium]